MIETAPAGRSAAMRRFPLTEPRSERSRSIRALFAALVGVACLILTLVWIMNLEARLPSIRVGDVRGSATAQIRTLDPGAYQVENPAITFSGNWFKQTLGSSTSSGTTSSMVTATSGSTIAFQFYGTDLGMTARIGPESGKVYVTIDGQASSILTADRKGSYVDLYANQAQNVPIQIATGLAHRDHTVQLTSEGNNEVAISGFHIAANTPFPWAFVFLYAALSAALFVLVRISVISTGRHLGWL